MYYRITQGNHNCLTRIHFTIKCGEGFTNKNSAISLVDRTQAAKK